MGLSSAPKRSSYRALHWRLTFFYTAALAILFGLLGWYLDRQLWNFAILQMDDRVSARAATVMGTTIATPKGTVAFVKTALPRFIPLPAGVPSPPVAGPSRPSAALRFTGASLATLASDIALTDTGNVTTTLLASPGTP